MSEIKKELSDAEALKLLNALSEFSGSKPIDHCPLNLEGQCLQRQIGDIGQYAEAVLRNIDMTPWLNVPRTVTMCPVCQRDFNEILTDLIDSFGINIHSKKSSD